MHSEKELQQEITRLTKLCKEKQEQVLNTFSNEEKRLNVDFRKKESRLLKKQHKESEQLIQQLKNKRKVVTRRLKKEQQFELRLIKRYEGLKSHSSNVISVSPDQSQSDGNSIDRPASQSRDVVDILSHSSVSRYSPHGIHSSRGGRNVADSRQSSTTNGTSEHKDDYTSSECEKKMADLLKRLKQEMDERMQYTSSSENIAIAELEWKFMQVRHQFKRDFVELMADFKQSRLTSLSQMKRNQLKGYYEIHRKWMTDQHTRELDNRQRGSQEALKRLTAAQTIERQTACRLAETTAKGQRQMSRILNTIEMKAERVWPNRPSSSASTQELYTPGNPSNAYRPMTVDTTLIDVLFPQTGNSTPEPSPRDRVGAHRLSTCSLLGNGAATDGHREAGGGTGSSIAPSEREGSNEAHGISLTGSRLVGARHPRSRYDPTRQGLRHAKSVQSLQSALVTCGDAQRSMITVISRQHMDQWAEVMNRERELTDALIQAQANQKQGLIAEESAALRRTEMEQNYRMAHLSVYLEASEKFMEKEFAEERTRLVDYYYKQVDNSPAGDQPLPSPFAFLDDYHCQPLNEEGGLDAASETSASLDVTAPGRMMDKSVETDARDFRISLSVNRRRNLDDQSRK